MSLLKQNLYNPQLLPEQVDQLVILARNMVVRRQAAMAQTEQLVNAGVVSRAEAQATTADIERAQTELQLAIARAQLIQQIAESVRLQKSLASLESEAQTHPEWAGKVYSKYAGTGVFTPANLQAVEMAYMAKFARPLPISADEKPPSTVRWGSTIADAWT